MYSALEVLQQYYMFVEQPMGSIEYESALNMSLVIKILFERQILDKVDVEILDYFLQGFSLRKIASMLNLDRKSVSKRFKRILVFIGMNYDS